MNLSFHSRLANILIVLSLCIFLTSCGDDEKPVEKTLFTVTIPAGSLNSHQDLWYFLTDEGGELLDIQEAIDGLDIVFKRPSGFKDKKFTVNQLIYLPADDGSYTDFEISSYAGISGGEIRHRTITAGGASQIGEYTFSITGVPAGYSPSLVAPRITGGNSSGAAGNFTGAIGLLQNNTPFMLWFKDPGNRTKVPHYAFVSDASVGGSLTSAFADLTAADEITYNFGTSVERVDIQANAYIPGVGPAGAFESFYQTNVNSSKLYHPGNTFPAYNTYIRLFDGAESISAQTIGSIPPVFKPLAATIDALSMEGNHLTVHTTGAYDFLYAFSFTDWFTGTKEHWLTWYVVMDDATEKTFSIPAFPAALTERYPELLTATYDFHSVTINDSDNVNGYAEYLQNGWHTAAFPLFSESLTRVRDFSSSSRMPFELPARTKR